MNQRIATYLTLATVTLGAPHLGSVLAQTAREDRHRVPADYMSFRGADWLERADRVVQERPEQVLDAMQLRPGDVVADVGCGSGYYARRIAQRVQPGGTVYCEDIQPEMLEIMQARAQEARLTGIRPVLGTPTDSGLPRGAIDWIFIADVYHEMSDPEAMLASMGQALAPEGRVALLEYRVEDGTGDQIKADHTMSVRQVLGEWQTAGFELAELHEFLPAQHLFFFRLAGTQTRDDVLMHYDLFDAVERGVVEVQAVGAGATAITLRIRRLISRETLITTPAAMYLRADPRTRDMIARRDGWVVLTDDEWQELSIRAVGRQRDREAPRPGDRLEALPPETAPTLDELMHTIQIGTYTVEDSPILYPPRTFAMEQAAVWLADSDVDYRTVSGDIDNTPIPRQYAVAFALVFCDLAGIDVTARRIWIDREEVFGGLRDQGLVVWYQVKNASPR